MLQIISLKAYMVTQSIHVAKYTQVHTIQSQIYRGEIHQMSLSKSYPSSKNT